MLLAAVLTLASCGFESPASSIDSSPQNAEVVVVLDGDSLEARVGGDLVEVRLLGLNAPERDECFDAEAKDALRQMVGESVTISSTDLDQFGRTLAYLTDPEGRLINLKMVEDGLALALTSDHERLSQFKAAEQRAFEGRKGIWQANACGPAANAKVTIRRIEADAPGDDADNPEGEWIEIRNDGRESVDLSGWVIRDESSRHRFLFSSGFSLEGSTTLRVLSGMSNNRGVGEWSSDEPVWSNRGDTGYLLDPVGNIVSRLAY